MKIWCWINVIFDVLGIKWAQSRIKLLWCLQFLEVFSSSLVHFIVCLYSSYTVYIVLNVLKLTVHMFLYIYLVVDNSVYNVKVILDEPKV